MKHSNETSNFFDARTIFAMLLVVGTFIGWQMHMKAKYPNMGAKKATAAKSAKIGDEEMGDQVRWIRSYVVEEPDGKLGTVCIYEARDQASIREHARRVGMPGEAILPILKTVVVRPDPATA